MTREQAKELLPVIQAYAEGKAVQIKAAYDQWKDAENPAFHPLDTYRIKPEPREWWLARYAGSSLIYACHSSKAAEGATEVIHVREVLP